MSLQREVLGRRISSPLAQNNSLWFQFHKTETDPPYLQGVWNSEVSIETFPSGKPLFFFVFVFEEVLDVDAWHLGTSLPGVVSVHLLFSLSSFLQRGQHLSSWHCLWMHSSQETDKTMFYGQMSWDKNPSLPFFFFFFCWFCVHPKCQSGFGCRLRRLTWGHTDVHDVSHVHMMLACLDNRLMERKPGLSTGFPSQTPWNGEQPPLQG